MDYNKKRALVMGLGLNGGGLETAKFLLSRGAVVTVTDMKDEKALLETVTQLNNYVKENNYPSVIYSLGGHKYEDFENADIVLKNPIVPPDSPYLQKARQIETDISLFLRENTARLTCISGSKGKSTTASAIHFALDMWHKKTGQGGAYLGGNITVSPLTFIEKIDSACDVVLELSSWQLGDLRDKKAEDGSLLLKPRVSVLTKIMSDHQNWYGNMESYVNDKRVIYAYQNKNDSFITINDDWGKSFLEESRAKNIFLLPDGKLPNTEIEINSKKLRGAHNKQNLHLAYLALLELGLDSVFIKDALEEFPGIEHRMELFLEKDGIFFYNDSAATIPEAVLEAVGAINDIGAASILVTGGTDKALNFSPLCAACEKASSVILLSGTGTDKLIPLLEIKGVPFFGPFNILENAVQKSIEEAKKMLPKKTAVLFSPGATSFGMFQNEFDRGKKFKAACLAL